MIDKNILLPEEIDALLKRYPETHDSESIEKLVTLSIELGQTEITHQKYSKLSPGDILSLEQGISEPLKVLVDDSVVAYGKLQLVNNKYVIAITKIIRLD